MTRIHITVNSNELSITKKYELYGDYDNPEDIIGNMVANTLKNTKDAFTANNQSIKNIKVKF